MQTWNNIESTGQRANRWDPSVLREVPEPTMDTVLVVDDDESIAQLLGEFLESAGYRVVLAGNGRVALALARIFQPSVVLTDAVMPEMDGHVFVRMLRASPQLRHIPVILMSSTRPTAATLREIPFIAKPFDLDALLACVDQVANHQTDDVATHDSTLTH